MTTTPTAAIAAPAPAKSEWRTVLGHYPTGVTLITSVDEQGGPVGMVVGTFTSVSEQPPLIGFLPQVTSRTWGHIQRAGRFHAAVLGAGHEAFCRDFFRAAPQDRFAGDAWEFDEGGVPRFRDSVIWFDAEVYDIVSAGDHVMVLGRVTDMGLGASAGTEPLLFHQGGYGTFTSPTQA